MRGLDAAIRKQLEEAGLMAPTPGLDALVGGGALPQGTHASVVDGAPMPPAAPAIAQPVAVPPAAPVEAPPLAKGPYGSGSPGPLQPVQVENQRDVYPDAYAPATEQPVEGHDGGGGPDQRDLGWMQLLDGVAQGVAGAAGVNRRSYQPQIANESRQRTLDYQAQAKATAAAQQKAAMGDPSSPQSQSLQKSAGPLLSAVGFTPQEIAGMSAAQISQATGNPLDARKMMQAQNARSAKAEEAARAKAAQDALGDPSSEQSQHAVANAVEWFTLEGLDKYIPLLQGKSANEVKAIREQIESNRGKKWMSPHRGVAMGGKPKGPALRTSDGDPTKLSGDVDSPSQAIAHGILKAYPPGADKDTVVAEVEQAMSIKDESQRKDALKRIEDNGDRVQKRLDKWGSDTKDIRKIKRSFDAAMAVIPKSGEIQGVGKQGVAADVAGKVFGSGGMIATGTERATVNKEGRVIRAKLKLLEEMFGREQSGAAIGLEEEARFKVLAGLRPTASDEQIRESLEILGEHLQSAYGEAKALNPTGEAAFQRNMGGAKPQYKRPPPGVAQ